MTNLKQQLVNLYKSDLISIYKHAISAVKPDNLIKGAIKLEDNSLIINDPLNPTSESIRFNLNGRKLHVIGGGKCVLGMAKGLAEVCQQANGKHHLFSHGCLSLPIGLQNIYANDAKTKSLLNSIGIESMFGSENNLPDSDSVAASGHVLKKIAEACLKDHSEKLRPLFIVLISGGGSACLASPKNISLQDKKDIIKQLVQKGADIVELNKFRRYFSHIKGGNLALHILRSHPEAQVLSLIMSDVIGDPIEFIASGPTFVSRESCVNHHESMLEVMRKYGLNHCLSNLGRGIDEDKNLMQYEDIQDGSVMNILIGNNKIAINAATSKAKEFGYSVECLSSSIHGPTDDIVCDIMKFGDEKFVNPKSTSSKKFLFIAGGEATVNKKPNDKWGKGGRAQEMTLDYLISKLSNPIEDETNIVVDLFLAGGTDGQDGPTDVAGCLASYFELKMLDRNEELIHLTRDANKSKAFHDSYNFWHTHKPNWLIKTGMTGTNVMDLYFYLKVNTSHDM